LRPLDRFHRRIHEKAANSWAAPVLIVAFGDSVTQGMTSLDEQTHDDVYHARFLRLLQRRYPTSVFSVLNAGVGGQTASGALELIDRDVLRHQPDLTLVSFALNDVWAGLDAVTEFVEAMNEIVRRIRARTESDVILMTPNFMTTRESLHPDSELRALLKAAADLQNAGVLGSYAQAVRDVARAHRVPCADVYQAWEDLLVAGTDVDLMLANGLNHPTADAHAIPAGLLMGIVTAAEARPSS
jgi:lysophospholipase L1-like esterase